MGLILLPVLNFTTIKLGVANYFRPGVFNWQSEPRQTSWTQSTRENSRRSTYSTVMERTLCITLQIAFYYASVLSGVPDSNDLASIALHWNVQTNNGKRVLQCRSGLSLLLYAKVDWVCWMDAVPGCLVGNAEFHTNMQRLSDANNSWTQFITCGAWGRTTTNAKCGSKPQRFVVSSQS